MKYKRLGRTDIEVSELCLGSMTWGSQNSELEAHAQLDYAIGEGINFIDTAEMYPTTPRLEETSGLSEKIIGEWLKTRSDRERIVVASKITGEGNKHFRGGARVTGAMVREALEASLLRLQTDYIDLYQLHWPNRGSYHFRKYWTFDPGNLKPENIEQEICDILGEVELLQNEGKLREFGLSNESAWGVMKFFEVSSNHDLPRPVSIQNEYSLICRIFDLDLSEVSRLEDIGLMAFSPLAAGSVTGKYLGGEVPDGSRKSMQPNLNGRYGDQAELAIALYQKVANKHGLELSQMALAFCLTRPFMMSAIIGATSMAQLKSNIAAKDLILNQDVLADIQSVYRDYPLPI